MIALTSCAPPASLDNATVRETVAKDRNQIYQHGEISDTLTLEEVLARALRHNLDTRVAELDELIAAKDVSLENLSALPSITAKLQHVGRSNPGGSSSFSLLTGTQSLQPSISTDQYRNTQLLNVEWSLLDAVISLGRGRDASDRVLIAQERRRKVYHNVVQDAYAAYWRVAAAQSALPIIDDLMAQADEQVRALDSQMDADLVPLGEAQQQKADLLDRRKELMTMKQGLVMADIELKTLIDYPLDKPIAIDLAGKDWLATSNLPKVRGNMDKLEETALLNRPEVREEIMNKSISMRDIKMAVIETLPGLNVVLSFNRDSNSFLSYKTWIDGVVGLTQSISQIITAPARIDRAKKVDLLSDKRRQALLAAIITQVHVARARFDFLTESYNDSVTADSNAQDILKRAANFKSVGMMSKPALLNVKIDASISAINRSLAYVDVQDAYGRFITTMGVDLWDADNAGLSVPDFAKQIRKNLSNENIFLMDPVAVEADSAPAILAPPAAAPIKVKEAPAEEEKPKYDVMRWES